MMILVSFFGLSLVARSHNRLGNLLSWPRPLIDSSMVRRLWRKTNKFVVVPMAQRKPCASRLEEGEHVFLPPLISLTACCKPKLKGLYMNRVWH